MLSNVEVRDFKVRSLDIDFNELSWTISTFTASQADILDYTFTVLRSEAAEGPYDDVSPAMSDQYIFIDNHTKVGHFYRDYFYKVRLTEKATGAYKDTEPTQQEAEPDLIATELRKHMNLLFREFIGRRCWVLPIRTFGMRCQCWNESLQKRVRSGCKTCFDTGFVRGYMSPVESWISIDPNSNALQQTNIGELQQNNTTARCGYYPPLKPRDLIIEPENNRWRVVQVNRTEQLRAPVHYEIQLQMIPKSDIEYAITIDPGQALRDMYFSPARNFTNPHNLENFEREEIPGIFALYQTSYPPVKT